MAKTRATDEFETESLPPAGNPDNRMPGLEGAQTHPRTPPNYDATYVSPEESRKYGLDPNKYQLHWFRNPDYWERTERSNRIRIAAHEMPGLKIAKDEQGEPVTMTDLILAGIPKEHMTVREQQMQEQMEQFNAAHVVPESQQGNRLAEARDSAIRSARRTHEELRQYSPTFQMPYDMAVATRKKGQVESDESYNRTQGRDRGKVFSLPAKIEPKNLRKER